MASGASHTHEMTAFFEMRHKRGQTCGSAIITKVYTNVRISDKRALAYRSKKAAYFGFGNPDRF